MPYCPIRCIYLCLLSNWGDGGRVLIELCVGVLAGVYTVHCTRHLYTPPALCPRVYDALLSNCGEQPLIE